VATTGLPIEARLRERRARVLEETDEKEGEQGALNSRDRERERELFGSFN